MTAVLAVMGDGPQQSDPVARLGLAIALLLTAAKLCGDLAARLKQSVVLGELVAGIALGSLPWPAVRELRADPYVDMLARLGILFLLFEVGLESTVGELARVGASASLVAVIGTLASFGSGYVAARFTLPSAAPLVHVFIAAAITATSVGISARVLKDANATRSREAHTVLGAAVLDDVLGLIVLGSLDATLGGAADGDHFDSRTVVGLAAKTLVFLLVAIGLGRTLSPRLFDWAANLRTTGALVAAGLSFCFCFAWAANALGLSPIIGAFTAGLVLEETHSSRFVARGEPSLAARMEPISAWLVPVFFVVVGMRADLGSLLHPATLLLTAALAVAATLGKLACALGAPARSDRLTIALGMLPRGEVTLVFANLGASVVVGGAPLLGATPYSALVAVVILTTLATPVALRWRLAVTRPTASESPTESGQGR